MAAPDQAQTLDQILPDTLKTNVHGWKTKYAGITRGDLMRLAGFSPVRDIRERQEDWKPVPNLGPYNGPGGPYPNGGPGNLSGVLLQLNAQDMITLSRILEKYNGMSYGTSLYFCCSCV